MYDPFPVIMNAVPDLVSRSSSRISSRAQKFRLSRQISSQLADHSTFKTGMRGTSPYHEDISPLVQGGALP